MSFWGELKRRKVVNVAVAYLVMVWLLILAVTIIFPFLSLPDYAATLVITLLLIPGFPLALFLAWAYKITPDGAHVTRETVTSTRSTRARQIEIAFFLLLLIAVISLTVERFSPEEATVSAPTASSLDSIRIGVISPTDGSRSRTTGIAHEAAVWLGFEQQGEIRIGSAEIDVIPIFMNDQGEGSVSARHAIDLVRNHNVAAILGPVNSNATEAVINALRDEGISIPVISSLSTAPSLTESGQRDPNFFRLSINDADRMAAFAEFMELTKGRSPNQNFLFLFEDDVFGEELADSLEDSFWSNTIINRMTWCDAIASADGSHCENNRLSTDMYDDVVTGMAFSPELEALLVDEQINNIVYLGTNEGGVEIANGIDTIASTVTHWFVGNNRNLFDKAPTGSYTIGNPVLDPNEAPDTLIAARWNSVLAEFEADAALNRSDFVITAYEAGSVLNQALRAVLREKKSLPPIEALRTELRDQIEQGTFESLEPWRRVAFFAGDLRDPPDVPIYVVGRGFTRADQRSRRSWIDISVAESYNYLESPIQAHLQGYDVNSARVRLERLHSGVWNFVRAHEVDFTAGTADLDFHVFRTGTYRVSVDGASPAFAETQIILSPTYILSTIAALIGAWIIVSRDRSQLTGRINRLALGVFAGFVLTFSSLYGNEIAGWFPFPSFGDEPNINALITGLIGGLLGPYVLAEAFVNWAMILSVRLDRKPHTE